jgi:DNA replication and repair protein RecF
LHISRLQIQGIRCLDEVRLDLDPGLNVLTGPNGAGKSSVLEAVYVLSHGRSFRSGSRDALVQRDRSSMSIYAELQRTQLRGSHLGIGRRGGRWQVKIDGEEGKSISDLVAQCAVVCFEPGSHALIAGPAEERRRYLDWGVFHVEHGFLDNWRRYQRAMRQRNVVLRDAGREIDGAALAPWEDAMSRAGERVACAREHYLERLRPELETSLGTLLPELGEVQLDYRRGWSEDMTLDEVLFERRHRDASRGHTGAGPHRADWSLRFQHAPQREHLSRGQEKLCALGCLLAQARLYARDHGEWPIFCIDDMASELDQAHQESLVQALQEGAAQVLITGTDRAPALEDIPLRMFHVEHGIVRGAATGS